MANNTDGIFGGYSPEPNPTYIKTPLQGLRAMGKNILTPLSFLEYSSMHTNSAMVLIDIFVAGKTTFAEGCQGSDTHCGDYDSESVKAAVTGSQMVVICLGTGAAIEQESNDRSDIELPGHQGDLLKDAVAAGASRDMIE